MLVTNLDYSDYLGRLAIGRVFNGTLRNGDEVGIAKLDGTLHKTQDHQAVLVRGPEARSTRPMARPGDIVAVAGVEGINIGETITDAENPDAAAPHRTSMNRPSP